MKSLVSQEFCMEISFVEASMSSNSMCHGIHSKLLLLDGKLQCVDELDSFVGYAIQFVNTQERCMLED